MEGILDKKLTCGHCMVSSSHAKVSKRLGARDEKVWLSLDFWIVPRGILLLKLPGGSFRSLTSYNHREHILPNFPIKSDLSI